MKTIRAKIRLCMSMTLLVALLVMGVSTSVMNFTSTMSTLEQTMTETVTIAAERVEKELEVYQQIAFEVGSEARLASPDNSVESKKEIVDQRAAIHGFERGNIIGMDGISIFDGNDYSERDYVQAAMQGKTSVSEPLISKITGKVTIIIAAPLWKNGVPDSKVVGVVYFVPKETFLNDIVSNIHFGEKGTAYMINAEGTTIADTTMETVSTQNIEAEAEKDQSLAQRAEVHAQMRQGKTGYKLYKQDKEYWLSAFAPINGTNGWSICMISPAAGFLESTTQGMIITVVILLLSITIATFIAAWLANGISRPIRACVERMQKLITDGDLHSSVPESKAKDETATLLGSVRVLVNGLNKLIGDMDSRLGHMAEGDFSVQSQCPQSYIGDFSGLLKATDKMAEDFSQTMHKIDQAANQVSSGSGQVSNSAQSLAQGATEQASSVKELADTIHDISEQVVETAERTGIAKEETAKAGQVMEICSGQMEHLVDSMETIDKKSKEISNVIKLIEDIASQTNILSLNASVEAARAGAAGKGFVVVANEVRELANKTAEAVKSTTALIEDTVRAVEEGTSLSHETHQSLGQVGESAQKVLGMVQEIDHSASSQTVALSRVRDGINEISGVVQASSAAAEESAAVSEELSGQAGMLKELVDNFKLKEI